MYKIPVRNKLLVRNVMVDKPNPQETFMMEKLKKNHRSQIMTGDAIHHSFNTTQGMVAAFKYVFLSKTMHTQYCWFVDVCEIWSHTQEKKM